MSSHVIVKRELLEVFANSSAFAPAEVHRAINELRAVLAAPECQDDRTPAYIALANENDRLLAIIRQRQEGKT